MRAVKRSKFIKLLSMRRRINPTFWDDNFCVYLCVFHQEVQQIAPVEQLQGLAFREFK